MGYNFLVWEINYVGGDLHFKKLNKIESRGFANTRDKYYCENFGGVCVCLYR